MSIKKSKLKPKKVKVVRKPVKPAAYSLTEPQDNALVELIEAMKSVDINSPDAKLNETSMPDGRGGRITYFLTQDMLEDAQKDKEVIREKWLELLIKRRMLQKLIDEARKISDANTRFYDFAHAVEVLLNIHRLVLEEGKNKFDRDVLWAAALFHDASNNQKKHIEGKEGAKIAESVLREISDFPQDKIGDVKRLIKSINRDPQGSDEVLISTADEMAALSSLGFVRSLMISGNKGMKVKEALEWELHYIDKRFDRLRLESAKRLSERAYNVKKEFLRNLLKMYEE